MSVKYANTKSVRGYGSVDDWARQTGGTYEQGNDGRLYGTPAPHGILDRIAQVAPYGIMAGFGYGALADAGVIGGAGAAAGGGVNLSAAPALGSTAPGVIAGSTLPAAKAGMAAKDLINPFTSLFGNIYGAHSQASAANKAGQVEADAARYAADKQDAAAQRAEAFQRQQAQQAAQQAEIDRKANYDQWAAQQAQHNRVREALGYPTSPIPPYVPGVTPNFLSAPTTGAPAAPSTAQPPLMPSVGSALAPRTPAPQGPAQMAAPAQSAYQPTPGSPLTMPPIGSVDDYLMRVRA